MFSRQVVRCQKQYERTAGKRLISEENDKNRSVLPWTIFVRMSLFVFRKKKRYASSNIYLFFFLRFLDKTQSRFIKLAKSNKNSRAYNVWNVFTFVLLFFPPASTADRLSWIIYQNTRVVFDSNVMRLLNNYVHCNSTRVYYN